MFGSNSQTNDSFDLVLFSESKTHSATSVTKTIEQLNKLFAVIYNHIAQSM